MKFQSLIGAIMHGSRAATSAVVFLACIPCLSGCVTLSAKKHTYTASSSAVRVNGADIRMQVNPQGTEGGSYAVSAMIVSAAVTTFDGPFNWRLEATGKIGEQESIIVHRIRTRTSKTKRDEWYPAAHLGKREDFKRVKGSTGPTRAVYQIPGLLVVKPREDGALEISVDLTVRSSARSERKTVVFRMDPSQKRQDEFIFVPTEIVNSIGKSPADWEEAGWD
ncbi:hypothetical protein JIN84_17080 [Luteolibacter yonseiensis]|uniref:Lipoprotein n=1 Tax=Luteolibacter yonseiensis TaxID=1144680 RepID=A0A934R6M2_9BACT|nr:hypothetical protein [Luteolibacter yonseiensis]MBK1817337.1 hypothetical protein [Luteolibacter yonseiensis]